MAKKKNINSSIEYKGKTYNLVFNLNNFIYVMNIQDYFMVNEKLNLTPEQLADINETFELEGFAQGMCFESSNFKEGVHAFFEKRKPIFN